MRLKNLLWPLLPLLAAGTLVGRALAVSEADYVDLPILGVSVPREVKLGSPLTIRVTAQGGGCVTYDRLTVTRKPDRIDLHLEMLPPEGPPHPCTTDLRPIPIQYTDPSYPSRNITLKIGPLKPLKVYVNGKLAGTVKLK